MPWDVLYYRDGDDSVPGLDFLRACPRSVRATMLAVLDAIAAAPRPALLGWRTLGGDAWQHARLLRGRKGGPPNRTQYRLFCLLENPPDESELRRRGLSQPAVAVVGGLAKPWMTTLSPADYASVRALGSAHLAQFPRRIAE